MKRLLVGMMAIAYAAVASAGTWFQAYNSGDWTAVNWGHGAAPDWEGNTTPSSNDTAYVDNNQTVSLNANATINALNVQRTSKTGTLNLDVAGKSLGVQSYANIGDGTAAAVLNVSEGDMNVAGALTVKNQGLVSVGNGSLTAGSYTAATGSSLKFVLGASGVNSLDVSGAASVDVGAKLVVDFGSYVYSGSGVDTNLLLNAASLSRSFVVSYTNEPAVDYTVEQDTASGNVMLLMGDLPQAPGSIVWENDMSADPVGDGWTDRNGSSDYMVSGGLLTMNAGQWSTLIDTDPYNEFKGTTKVDMLWRTTSLDAGAGGLGAGIWLNVDGDAPTYAAIHIESILQSNNTQTVVVFEDYNSVNTTIPGFGPGMLDLSATIDAFNETVDYIISDGSTSVTGTVSYVPTPTDGTTVAVTLFTAGPSAEFDYVRVEANATPQDVYFAVNPDELNFVITAPETTGGESLDITCDAGTNLNVTISLSDESHPGGFSVVLATNQVLAPLSTTAVDVHFDQVAAGLSVGQTATGLVTIAWSEAGGGESGSVVVPLSATYAGPRTYVRSGTDTTWSGLEGWADSGNGWGPSTRMPMGLDTVVMNNNDSPDLYVDIDAEVKRLEVVNDPSNATLHMTNDVTLSVLTELRVGVDGQAGTGTVNQATGTINVATLTVNTKDAYSLAGGGLTVSGSATINGELVIDGGTFSLLNDDANLNGSGVVKLMSGSITGSPDSSGAQSLRVPIEISGGSFEMLSQVLCYGAISVIGDDASIAMRHIQTTDAYGSFGLTLNYALDESGVSPVNVTSWMFLQNTSINVDGSGYAGGSQTINLINGVSMNGLIDPANITVSGFGEGYAGEVTVDAANGDVVLTITASGYQGWKADYGLIGSDGNADADPDGDLVSNIREYALGGNPTNSADRGMDSAMVAGADHIDYIHVRRVGGSNDVSYALSLTDNLIYPSWATNSGYTVVGYGPEADGFDTVTNRIDTTGKTAEFIDLVIEAL